MDRRYTVFARNPARELKGTLPYLSLKARTVFCGVGGWSVRLNPDNPKATLLQPGWGVVIRDDETGETFASGPVRKLAGSLPEPTRDAPAREELVASGVTDEWYLATRLVYPDPTQPATNQVATAYYTDTDVAETALRALVDLNAGPGALTAREVPGLVLEAADALQGSTVKVSSRFDVLVDQLAAAALAGGVGWRVALTGLDLEYQVFTPRDRSAFIRFSTGVGNLRSYAFDLGGPDATRAIVAGSGEGTARAFAERSNTTAETDWTTRVEVFVDRRDTNDATTLNQAGDEQLAETGPTAALSLAPTDTPTIRYGVDGWLLGDTVTRTINGQTAAELIREVELTVEADTVRLVPLIGESGSTDPRIPRIYRDVRQLARRTGGVETRR